MFSKFEQSKRGRSGCMTGNVKAKCPGPPLYHRIEYQWHITWTTLTHCGEKVVILKGWVDNEYVNAKRVMVGELEMSWRNSSIDGIHIWIHAERKLFQTAHNMGLTWDLCRVGRAARWIRAWQFNVTFWNDVSSAGALWGYRQGLIQLFQHPARSFPREGHQDSMVVKRSPRPILLQITSEIFIKCGSRKMHDSSRLVELPWKISLHVSLCTFYNNSWLQWLRSNELSMAQEILTEIQFVTATWCLEWLTLGDFSLCSKL